MGKLCMDLYLKHMRLSYKKANKKLKSQILEKFCAEHGYHKKSAIRLLNNPAIPEFKTNKGGKPPIYDKSKLLAPLKKIWLASDQMCSKRLKKAIPLWLPYYENHYQKLSDEIMHDLKVISASTIDRMLKPIRVKYNKGLSGTKPGSLLKNQIPIKTNQWNTKEVGYVEADTVAHCGDSLKGDFVWSLTLTDILTGWTENRATWNKGSTGVIEQIKDIEENLPFPILGFDCDNGSEFLNYHLLRYFTEREKSKSVQFTRSRPYKKNDNAHVEQKNWTHVRQVFGYHRFDNSKLVSMMNNVYSKELSQLTNFFYPSVKLLDKQRVNSKTIKIHDEPKTPSQRVMEATCISVEIKEKLTKQRDELDPFKLKKMIEKKLKPIFALVNLNSKQKRKAI